MSVDFFGTCLLVSRIKEEIGTFKLNSKLFMLENFVWVSTTIKTTTMTYSWDISDLVSRVSSPSQR